MPAPRKKISYQEFLHREYQFFRAPLAPEMDFYETIRTGNLRKIKNLLNEPFHEKKGLGVLSDDPLQNLKYHLTITIALVARFCISGGLSQSESYSLSDYYIRMTDEAQTPEEITDIHNEMCIHYTELMQSLQKTAITSKAVSTCINYIYEHLHKYDIEVQPSLSEGFGLTAAEAMAAQIPVLVSDQEALLEVIDNGSCGYYFKTGDYVELSQKLIEIMRNNSNSKLLAAGKERVSEFFDVKITAKNYLNNYKELKI